MRDGGVEGEQVKKKYMLHTVYSLMNKTENSPFIARHDPAYVSTQKGKRNTGTATVRTHAHVQCYLRRNSQTSAAFRKSFK
jgi:hypothetical protein